MLPLSHHSSNPLEARPSDPLNNRYKRQYTGHVSHFVELSSDDPLGRFDSSDTRQYQRHVASVVPNLILDKGTPKKVVKSTWHEMKELVDVLPIKRRAPSPSERRLKSSTEFEPAEPQQPMNDDDQEMPDAIFSSPLSSAPNSPLLPEQVELAEQGRNLQEELEDIVIPEEANPREEVEEEILEDARSEEGLPNEPATQTEEAEEEVFEDDFLEGDAELEDETGILLESDSDHESNNRDIVMHARFSDGEEDMGPLRFSSSRPSSPVRPSSSLSQRPPDEQAEIQQQIAELYEAVPELKENYELLDRLGTGTFSSVYKAVDLHYSKWFNKPWLGSNPPNSSAYYQTAGPQYKGRGGRASKKKEKEVEMEIDVVDDVFNSSTNKVTQASLEEPPPKAYVAIKRIYATSSPERIRNELAILRDTRGCRHTSQIITAFREHDQVVVILPYQRNTDFRDSFETLSMEGIKAYLRCLFRSLRDIHARGIIHRDVKPANFLFDAFTGIGTLCDFGLASRMEATPTQSTGKCNHTVPSETFPHGKASWTKDEIPTIKRAQRLARDKSTRYSSDRVGWPMNDKRPQSKANRAGTRGFRAPEVLLKCSAQSGAIDVWSAGVILLFFLTRKYPLFQSNDDVEGLMEIAVIIGMKKLEEAATLHSRTVSTNIPSITQEGTLWKDLVEKLNPDIWVPNTHDWRYYPYNSKHKDGRDLKHHNSSSSSGTVSESSTAGSGPGQPFDAGGEKAESATTKSQISRPTPTDAQTKRHHEDVHNALDFLERVMHHLATKRMTPREALYHPFLAEPGMPDDDFTPHVVGGGVCGRFHSRDPVTEVHMVVVRVECECEEEGCVGWKWQNDVVDAGQGVPIGREPCEYHRDPMYREG